MKESLRSCAAVAVGVKTQVKSQSVCLGSALRKKGGVMASNLVFIAFTVLLIIGVGIKRR